MNQDEETYQFIEQYLQGALPDGHPFVQKLSVDKDLAEEVAVHKLVPEAVIDYRLMAVEKLVSGDRIKFIKDNSKSWTWSLWLVPVVSIGILSYLYTSYPVKDKKNIHIESISPKEHTTPSVAQIVKPANPVAPDKDIAGSAKIASPEKTENRPIAEITAPLSPSTLEIPASPVIQPAIPTLVAEQKSEKEAQRQKEVNIPKIDPCTSIRMKAFIEEDKPCNGTADGQLSIKDVRGGKAPYRFSIDRKSFQEENKFQGLKEAEYDILVKDADGCEAMVFEKYPLRSKNCIEFKDHVFNPTITTWEVPTNPDKNGELSLFDGNGQRIYFRVFEKSHKLFWEGTSDSGKLLLPGVYIYHIKYADGVEEQGRITIIY